MTESSLTRALIPQLKRLQHAVVLKHSDRFTAAIPDLSLSWAGFTHWVEIKYLTKSTDVWDKKRGVRTDQREMLTLLHHATGGRAYALAYRAKAEWELFYPDGTLVAKGKGHWMLVQYFAQHHHKETTCTSNR